VFFHTTKQHTYVTLREEIVHLSMPT
jgi:hypothetical protein